MLEREPAMALFCDPGLGKSRTVIDATVTAVRAGEIDTLVVVAPATARSVWADPDPLLGEVSKWMDRRVPLTSLEFRGGTRLPKGTEGLTVVVTNPELVRRENHLATLGAWLKTRKATLVADESHAYSNARADQTKALWALGTVAKRTYILTGTPGEMKHLYGQYRIFGPQRVFPGIKSWFQYRGNFCRMGGWNQKNIVGYQNEALFETCTRPFTIRRYTADCRDVTDPIRTQIDATLTPATWAIYQAMRRDLIADLSTMDRAVASHAGAKILRLAQITNGFVGGVEPSDLLAETSVEREPEREIGREKTDALIAWLDAQASLPPKIVIATRFRRDVARTAATLVERFGPLGRLKGLTPYQVVTLNGDTPDKDRHYVKTLFAPGGDPTPAIAVINAQSGGAGLNLAQAWLLIVLGHEYSQRVRVQLEGRIDRPGQMGRPMFVDVVASGPAGQRTIDHTILAGQRAQQDVAAWTSAMWRQALVDESRVIS